MYALRHSGTALCFKVAPVPKKTKSEPVSEQLIFIARRPSLGPDLVMLTKLHGWSAAVLGWWWLHTGPTQVTTPSGGKASGVIKTRRGRAGSCLSIFSERALPFLRFCGKILRGPKSLSLLFVMHSINLYLCLSLLIQPLVWVMHKCVV